MVGSVSGVALGKEMDYAIYVGSVAEVSEFHIDFQKFFHALYFDRKGRTIGQVVYECFYF